MLPGLLGQIAEYWWVPLVATASPLVAAKVVQLILGMLALKRADSKDVPVVVRALASWGKK
ncbi:hypothetical protein ACQEUU_05895 [Nonomuraea sp. CA-218870]|uniref:hypothetical protein n=1 Tax=Nonomuraea sp. CA-218870 TaxID=3239998 RepID=UPI003D93BBA5